MMYVVHAYDHTDSEALARRLTVRERHLEGVRVMKSKGTFHIGGALLDDEERMIGSMMLVEFDSPADLQDWLDVEPYVQEGVWKHIDVKPFRQAQV
jgi:uncharacterized protein YciI